MKYARIQRIDGDLQIRNVWLAEAKYLCEPTRYGKVAVLESVVVDYWSEPFDLPDEKPKEINTKEELMWLYLLMWAFSERPEKVQ